MFSITGNEIDLKCPKSIQDIFRDFRPIDLQLNQFRYFEQDIT